jgi:hypothetical protein
MLLKQLVTFNVSKMPLKESILLDPGWSLTTFIENDGGRGKRSRRPTNKAIEAKTDNGKGSWICK